MSYPTNRDTLPLIALAGHPNVGKSTLFNALTGMRQHTGNWIGKTVATAMGVCHGVCRLVDLPGTYSLHTHSAEEEVARDFLVTARPTAVVVVCDAACPERGVGLALQIREMGHRVMVCVNLMDEATRRGITVDLPLLEHRLDMPVVGVTARRPSTLSPLRQAMAALASDSHPPQGATIAYPTAIENDIQRRLPTLSCTEVSRRYAALRQMEADHPEIGDALAATVADTAARLCRGVVRQGDTPPDTCDRRIDRVLTSRWGGYPLMLGLLAAVLWLTLQGTNHLSAGLSAALLLIEGWLCRLLAAAPPWLYAPLIEGAWRMLSTVVAVMLPPMAVFFPLFTLLEDVGYLPRVAYNLDRPFARCGACGKQALTMCMGLGCNAAGVVGCRIIDSPRERLMAAVTNAFVPCNGRFPALITLVMLLGIGGAGGALALTGCILLGVVSTLLATTLLGRTLLRGVPSFFTLELPPYRPPRVGSVIVRSIWDRTLFVLGRAMAVAAPAGLCIWLGAHITVGDELLLSHAAAWMDPIGRALGMDGVILLAFLLGWPANEVVLPLAVMLYTAGGTLPLGADSGSLTTVLSAAGWTPVTALCVALFTLFHWPCSTTLWTIKKETGSWKWTAIAAVLPTLWGAVLCAAVAAIARGWG